MLRLIVKSGGLFKTYDFECRDLEKDIKQNHLRKLVGVEIIKTIPVPQTLPAGSLPRLISAGDRVIPAIKAVREHTGWGLKESKDFVESAPVDLPALDFDTTARLIGDLREAGATVGIPAESEAGRDEAGDMLSTFERA